MKKVYKMLEINNNTSDDSSEVLMPDISWYDLCLINRNLLNADCVVIESNSDSTKSIRGYNTNELVHFPRFTVSNELLPLIHELLPEIKVLNDYELLRIIFEDPRVYMVKYVIYEIDLVYLHVSDDISDLSFGEFSVPQTVFMKLKKEFEGSVEFVDIDLESDEKRQKIINEKYKRLAFEKNEKQQNKKPKPASMKKSRSKEVLSKNDVELLLSKGVQPSKVKLIQRNLKSTLIALYETGQFPEDLELEQCKDIVRKKFMEFLLGLKDVG